MSLLSNKCIYALRAILELSKQGCFEEKRSFLTAKKSITISFIAAKQNIPARFLESILRELKNAGITSSIRGKEGGYFLCKTPDKIFTGEIIRLFQNNLNSEPISNLNNSRDNCIEELNERAIKSYFSVLDNTSFSNLLEESKHNQAIINFSI